jgi:hypothetical protein
MSTAYSSPTSASSTVEDFDWADSAENVFERALETYREQPITSEIIQAKSKLVAAKSDAARPL